ncbi:MAG: N-6 DNA methylase [Ruminococcus flavefaciens]|nr:N-6 DNA methylase [Ruminococcus flavefaciens]
MNLRKWIIDHIENFNVSVKSEEDMKMKVLIPFLQNIGYEMDDIAFEIPIDVQIGTKKTTVFSDIVIYIDNKAEMVIDAKKPINSLTERDMLQAVSYAKLIDTPSALYGVVTNGLDCIVQDIVTGVVLDNIPSKNKLRADINKAKRNTSLDIEIKNEAKRILFTLNNQKEFYRVIQNCKDIIEKRGLIRSDQSFREMTKIILTKMNEERRVKANEGNNRFTLSYINSVAKYKNEEEIEIFKLLFGEAKNKYPSIYTNEDETININDNSCITEIIKKLEPFSFLGTGEDIKGTVYEIFLKATLRGEFDQYFTPRELVDFMVNCADPNMGDKILDPACGSGGFLIQAFKYVNNKINAAGLPEVENIKRFDALINKCLWGQEADYDLHVLAKINLIMHGDGWNNIYQGDTLKSDKLESDFFDLVLANPPFTIPYTFSDVLGKYELGIGKESEELDILFVEKSLKLLKPGCDMYIILPEGLLNIKKYRYFRNWLLSKADILMSISLPEGAFIPFGGSVSKTCILAIRKKGGEGYVPPKHVFLARSKEIGYEVGKKTYILKNKNDLAEFEKLKQEIFEGVKTTTNDGECGWIKQVEINDYRLDANYLLNKIDRCALEQKFDKLVPLSMVCIVDNESITVTPNEIYNYLEVLDISPQTGAITNIRRRHGYELGDSFHIFHEGDILFARINPRKNRVAIAPPINEFGIVSKEVYILKHKENEYISYENRYVICSILQSALVNNQIVRLSTGSSSSRARVQVEDFLNDVYIPIPSDEMQKEISKATYSGMMELWGLSQRFLMTYINTQKALGTIVDKDDLRSI